VRAARPPGHAGRSHRHCHPAANSRRRRAVVARRTAHALAAAEHLHLVDADVGGVLLDAVLVGVFAGADRALDVDLRALAQVLRGNLGQPAVEHQAVPFGRLAHLAALLVLPLVGGGDGHVADLVAAREGAGFRVAAEIADEDDFVDGCHVRCP
jgi:hypothetical protein